MTELRRLTRDENARAIEAMKKRGLRLSPPPSPEALAAMRRAGDRARAKLAGSLIPPDLLKRAGRVLAALRGKVPSRGGAARR